MIDPYLDTYVDHILIRIFVIYVAFPVAFLLSYVFFLSISAISVWLKEVPSTFLVGPI